MRPKSLLEKLQIFTYVPSEHMTFIQCRINNDATSRRYIDVNAVLYERHDVALPFRCCINAITLHGVNVTPCARRVISAKHFFRVLLRLL